MFFLHKKTIILRETFLKSERTFSIDIKRGYWTLSEWNKASVIRIVFNKYNIDKDIPGLTTYEIKILTRFTALATTNLFFPRPFCVLTVLWMKSGIYTYIRIFMKYLSSWTNCLEYDKQVNLLLFYYFVLFPHKIEVRVTFK